MSMNREAPSYIGADLGGTKLLLGEMDRNGTLLRSRQEPTGELDRDSACALLEQALERFLAESTPGYRPQGIGIGLNGHVNSGTGEWLSLKEGEAPVPVAQRISRRFSLPCAVNNDVKSATKAEMLFGYGRLTKNFVYINVGTGIAAGTVADGRLISGGHANAGEVGHTSSGFRLGIPCVCGREDCVETIASGSGLDRCARLLAPDYPDTCLEIPEGERIPAKEIFRLYGKDPLCTLLTDRAAQALANLIMNMVRFCDPEYVVLGGGIVADGFLLSHIRRFLGAHTMRYVTGGVRLTQLDPAWAGLIGACSNAMT